MRSSCCWPPVVSAAVGWCLWVLNNSRLTAASILILRSWPLRRARKPVRLCSETCSRSGRPTFAAMDCWFANQKRLYDAQHQEPDEMRWLRLANQQWMQEEEEDRQFKEESQRKRRRTDPSNRPWKNMRRGPMQRGSKAYLTASRAPVFGQKARTCRLTEKNKVFRNSGSLPFWALFRPKKRAVTTSDKL